MAGGDAFNDGPLHAARRRAIDVVRWVVRRERRRHRLISFEREAVEDEVMSALTAHRVRAEVAALPVALRKLDGVRP